MQIQTVNVVEYKEDTLISITSFSKDADGNKEAEECFKSFIKEQDTDIDDATLDSFVKDEYYEQGQYQLFLIRS